MIITTWDDRSWISAIFLPQVHSSGKCVWSWSLNLTWHVVTMYEILTTFLVFLSYIFFFHRFTRNLLSFHILHTCYLYFKNRNVPLKNFVAMFFGWNKSQTIVFVESKIDFAWTIPEDKSPRIWYNLLNPNEPYSEKMVLRLFRYEKFAKIDKWHTAMSRTCHI